jgi:hypothetical protein
MKKIKVTSWNIEHLDKLFEPASSPRKKSQMRARMEAVARQITEMNPDILCVIEGPEGEERIDAFATEALGGRYAAVKALDGQYGTKGSQWIWFLVKPELTPGASLLPMETWDWFAGETWNVNYWGDFKSSRHHHYRHPQVLVLEMLGTRIEFIGLHLKSKFVARGKNMWNKGGASREEFIRKAIQARIKLTTEAANVRSYIDRKFGQVRNPAIFVVGDLNDGPGKEYFEREYLFFDLLSNIQGDVFFARRFLNHALFDFSEDLRWTVRFEDFVDPDRRPEILLDHILFTQGLVDGSLPIHVEAKAGFVEHEVHELVNANSPKYACTSDHRPVSVLVTVEE